MSWTTEDYDDVNVKNERADTEETPMDTFENQEMERAFTEWLETKLLVELDAEQLEFARVAFEAGWLSAEENS